MKTDLTEWIEIRHYRVAQGSQRLLCWRLMTILFKVARKHSVQNKRLKQVLELCKVASCTCLTKTPEVKFHKETCRYRQICEALI